jgi:hypothetical protein
MLLYAPPPQIPQYSLRESLTPLLLENGQEPIMPYPKKKKKRQETLERRRLPHAGLSFSFANTLLTFSSIFSSALLLA